MTKAALYDAATYYTAPEDQGQIVEVSYCACDGNIIQRTRDHSCDKTTYAVSRMLAADNGDYWNAPPRNLRWRTITQAEAQQLTGEPDSITLT